MMMIETTNAHGTVIATTCSEDGCANRAAYQDHGHGYCVQHSPF